MEPREQEYGLLVVSDLHLSEGRHEVTKRFSRNEDFFFDDEFARFLEYYQDEKRSKAARWHLLIDGDFLDLLQVVSIDGAPDALRRDRDHPEYGLACGEDESVFKLRKIANGHWRFFEALAAFVASGNRLTILKGNHDVEFHYRGLQAAFVGELEKAFHQIPSPPPSSSATLIDDRAVRFGDWFHYEKDLLWIEHGNRYDSANTFRTWLAPLLPAPSRPTGPGPEIDLPLGSLFVRYLFNRIESVEPFADNIKPPTKFVRWLLARHPVTALRFLLGDGRYMLRKLRRAWTPRPAAAFQVEEAAHQKRLEELARDAGIPIAKLARIDALRAKSILEETTGFWPRCAAFLVRTRLALPLVVLALVVAGVIGALAALQALSVLVPPFGRAVASVELLNGVNARAPWVLLAVLLALAAAGVRRALAPEEKPEQSELVPAAEEIASLLGVRYVVMGHTHDAELRRFLVESGPEERVAEYFNTGTWTKVFSEEERLIRDDVEFVFLEGLRTGPHALQVKLMEWDDAASEPRLLKLFDDDEAERSRSRMPSPRAGGVGLEARSASAGLPSR